MNKNSPRHNRFRNNISRDKALPVFDFMHGIEFTLKVIMAAILVSLTTLCFIFVENAVVQSNMLAIKEISVAGTNILSKEEVIEQAEIYPEDNIFSVNLRHTRLRIISHPWIEDASVKRSLPSKIIITIKEEIPLAVVHIPDKVDIILNSKGIPFTENDAIGSDIYINEMRNIAGIGDMNDVVSGTGSVDTKNKNVRDSNISMDITADTNNTKNNISNTKDRIGDTRNEIKDENSNLTLPVITGLGLSKEDGVYGFSGRLYESVMELLLMKKNDVIQKISADEESGIEMDMIINANPTIKPALQIAEESVQLTDLEQQQIPLVSNPVKIKIGFDNYDEKFKIIRHIINYMQKNRINKQVWSIDLINTENVVIKVKDITGNALPKGINAMPEHIDGGA